MAKLQKVLVAYDGSPQSKEALHWAIYFSRKTGAAVSAVKVFEPILRESKLDEVGNMPEGLFEKYSAAQKKDLQLMAEVKEIGSGQEMEITTAVLSGHVAQTLLEYVKKNGMDMIVTGTRGLGTVKQMLLGSVTHGLVSLAEVPVLVVKKCPLVHYAGSSMVLAPMHKILVAYDGFPPSKAALTWAMEIAKLTNAQITLVKVFEPYQMGMTYSLPESASAARVAERMREIEALNVKMMEEAKVSAKQQGMDIETQILHGSILEAMLTFVEQQGFDMVAVGAQGHSVFDKLPLGSVPHGLVSLCPVPVLVVKK